mgnify:FL=1
MMKKLIWVSTVVILLTTGTMLMAAHAAGGYFYGGNATLRCANVVVMAAAGKNTPKMVQFPCEAKGDNPLVSYRTPKHDWDDFHRILRVSGVVEVKIQFGGGRGKWTRFVISGQALQHWFDFAEEAKYGEYIFYVPIGTWLTWPTGLPSLTLNGSGGGANVVFFPTWTGLPPLRMRDEESRKAWQQAIAAKKFILDPYYVELFERFDRKGR